MNKYSGEANTFSVVHFLSYYLLSSYRHHLKCSLMISTANTCWNSKNTEKSLLGIYIRQKRETDFLGRGVGDGSEERDMVRSPVLCHGVCYPVMGYIQCPFLNKNECRPVRLLWMRGMLLPPARF